MNADEGDITRTRPEDLRTKTSGIAGAVAVAIRFTSMQGSSRIRQGSAAGTAGAPVTLTVPRSHLLPHPDRCRYAPDQPVVI